jgi:hypothetical protein
MNMQIYENALTEHTLSIVHRELIFFMQQPDKWTCSNFKWPASVTVNVAGTTVITPLSDGCRQLVLDEIGEFLPKGKIFTQYFVWMPNSGISCHNDSHVQFGATLYLNETWDINDGGIFLYQQEDTDWRAHVPEFNTLIVNDTQTLHMVTPVSPFAKHNRYTIQIFGEKENE